MKLTQESERKAIAEKLASDPKVLANVRKSTEQFRTGQTITLAQLGRSKSRLIRIHGVTQSKNGPDRELKYAAKAIFD